GIWSDGTTIYIADTNNHTIRKQVIATGAVTTFAGFPGACDAVDGIGLGARFCYPVGVWGDGSNLYITDSGNGEIRKIVIATRAVTTLTSSLNDFLGQLWGDGANLYVGAEDATIRKVVIATGAVS